MGILGFQVNQDTADSQVEAGIRDTAQHLVFQGIAEAHRDFRVIVLHLDILATAVKAGIPGSVVLAEDRGTQDFRDSRVHQDIADSRAKVDSPGKADIQVSRQLAGTADFVDCLGFADSRVIQGFRGLQLLHTEE